MTEAEKDELVKRYNFGEKLTDKEHYLFAIEILGFSEDEANQLVSGIYGGTKDGRTFIV